ncbi:MAG: flagellar hook-associated protein FlgL [Planctomycetota bacterium]
MPIYPVPAGRSSDSLLTQRLLAQLQNEQKEMLDVEQQLGTGRRFQLPSGDPPSATRAITLQRLLEQKTQLRDNLSMGQSYLDATDTSLGGVSDLLNKARSHALIAADSTTSDSERKALALELDATINEMLRVGNDSFRGQYLFAGTESKQAPFEFVDDYIAYHGNDASYRSLADQDLLFETNITGHAVFGALSSEKQGIDLNPPLMASTRLSDLHGGQGISSGSIVIHDGTNGSTISLASARTLDDVVNLIEANPPEGRTVDASIEAEGLVIDMDDGGGGDLIIRDVQGGSTATELGIARDSGSATDPIVGEDLNPILRPTTQLDDVLGGTWDQTSGLQVSNGGETHVLDVSSAETVEDLLNIFNGSNAMVMAELNSDQNGINVRSRLSGSDFFIGENGGTTATDLGLRTLTSTTALADLNYRQGITPVSGADFIIHRNDGVDLEIDVSSAKTIGDVIDLVNDHPDNQDPDTRVVAALQAFGNGIELVDDNPAADESLTVSRTNRSEVAWELGLIPWGEDAPESSYQPAEATVTFASPDDTNTAFRVEAARAGTQWNNIDIEITDTGTVSGDNATVNFDESGGKLVIDIAAGDTTANTVVDEIIAEGTFTAELDDTTDPGNDGTGTLPAPGVVATTADGTPETLAGEDPNPIETEGVFNTLLRLQGAVESNEVEKLERIFSLFEADVERLNMGRAIVGTSSRGLNTIQIRNEDEQVELKQVLSDEIDVDLAEAVSEFSSRRAGYEASLRAIGNMYRLSLLDFL